MDRLPEYEVDDLLPSLSTMALELLTLITDFLTPHDVVSLMVTNNAMYGRTMPELYRRDIRGQNLAFRWACHYGVVPTVLRCLSHGADANAYFPPLEYPPSWNKATASHPTTMARDGDLLYPPLGDFYDTPLITAIRRKQAVVVKLLIERGADVNKPDRARSQNHLSLWFPIHWALEPHEVALKRNRDALFRVPNAGGWNIPVGDREILQYLIDAGAWVNQRTVCPRGDDDEDGGWGELWTPLYCAMSAAVPDTTVELLLRAGADPTLPSRHVYRVRRERMRTPFDAILSSFPTTMNWKKADHILRHRILCRPGKAVDKRQSWVETAEAGREEHDKPLNRHLTSRPSCPLLFDTIRNWVDHRPRVEVDVVVGLLKSIIDIDSAPIDTPTSPLHPPQDRGQTALRLACTLDTRLDMRPVIRLLVSSGADPNARDDAGACALHYAAQFGHVQRLRALLAMGGADVDARDALGWTPLHYAAQFGDRGQGPRQAVAAADLCAAGANVLAKNADGETPLHVACRAANAEVARALLEAKGGEEAVGVRDSTGRTPAGALRRLVVVYTASAERSRPPGALYDEGPGVEGFVGPRQYDAETAASENLCVNICQSADRVEEMLRARATGIERGCMMGVGGRQGSVGDEHGLAEDEDDDRDPRGRRCYVVNTMGAPTTFFSARKLADSLLALPEGGFEDNFVGSLTLGLRAGPWCISQFWC
jgi:ankyrin repeat protein